MLKSLDIGLHFKGNVELLKDFRQYSCVYFCVVERGRVTFVFYMETILFLVWRLAYKEAKKENRGMSLGATKITIWEVMVTWVRMEMRYCEDGKKWSNLRDF